ncbi:nif-specific transcriptional activator NifA [Beijerinckia indica]|uniref:Nif-specific regulatory protein n=1 Tax=Beijerinckia indica subsp. indica (strain ATCC 9039 / DSM 1715 / NCIMB 8712) TaxID=395963 RepID=B2IE22_BEII9|nr:nif-specific transcriptional activator NifA [Beijerinckia indica]ACB94046.1 transcriptional regulator, NifA, Fis Family [Beijerinckia indica subsp. indica ATCC 9039]
MNDQDHAEAAKTMPSHRIQLSEIALIGVYEISKILTAPTRLETTLANVLNLLSSFLQMRHGTIVLLADDGAPEVAVGAGWTEEAMPAPQRYPERAIGQIVATAVPLVVHNVADHELFDANDVAALASGGAKVSFMGVPIRAGDRVVGTLTVDRIWDGESVFRFDSDVRFLVMIANLIGQTVKLHRVVARDRDRLIEESHRLQKEITKLQPMPVSKARASGIIGESPAIRAVLDKISIVARSNATMLLRGESGTGKELFARALHEMSPRASHAFVKVNCAALAESVLESELFGHEKGAFTGAVATRKGRFELADGGTLFLDEIGEISLSFQAKLLRVLQEGEFERVGGTKTLKADVRLITATNKNLEEAVRNGEFRADLYYRISVVPVILPPLRERSSDIPLLAARFLEQFNEVNGRDLVFSKQAMEVLKSCYFPGNVRELENCVQRTATFAVGESIVATDFACGQDQCLSATLWKGKTSAEAWPSKAIGGLGPFGLPGGLTEPPHQSHPHHLEAQHLAHPQAYSAPPLAPPPVAVPHMPASPVPASSHPHVPLPPVTPKPAPNVQDVWDEGGVLVDVGGGGDTERARLLEAMEKAGWVQAKAARIMGLTPRQIGYALRKHGIEIKKF